MTARFKDHLLGPDTHANLPDPATTPEAAIYECTTHGKIYKNVSATWIDYGVLIPPGGTTGQALVKNSGTDGDVGWGSGGGGGGGWVSSVDDTLASTAGFMTPLAGTWSIIGGVLNQAATAASFSVITYNTVVGSPRAVEVEMNYTGGSGADRQMGLYISSTNTTSSGNLQITLQSTTSGASWVARVAAPGVTFYSSTSITYAGTGYVRVGAILVGDVVDIYINGTYLTSVVPATSWLPGRYVGLATYAASANFRNLKAWDSGATAPF